MTQQSNSMKISEQIDSVCKYNWDFDDSLKPANKLTAQRYIELLKLRQESYSQETRYIFESKTRFVNTSRYKHSLLDSVYRLSLKQNTKFPNVILNKIKSLWR